MSGQPKSKVTSKRSNIRVRYRADGTVRGYEARYRDPIKIDRKGNPVVRGKTFRTLPEAQDFQKRKAVEILDGDHIDPERLRTRWRTVADEWLEVAEIRSRARTVSGYRNVLTHWLSHWGDRRIDDLRPADVRGVIRDIRKAGRAVGTERHVFNAMNGVFKFAVKNDYIHKNPAAVVRDELRGQTERDFKGTALTTDQAMSIIASLPEGRYRLYGLLGLWTGLRAGELAGLRVRNLDGLRNVVQVEETIQDLGGKLTPGTTKTRKSKGRRVPIPGEVVRQVLDYVAAEELGADDYVFAGSNEYFRHANFYKRHWKPACEMAELPGTRFHTLRHTFVSLKMQEGFAPHVVAAWAGHSTPKVTMDFYTHHYEDDPRDRERIERQYQEGSRRAEEQQASLRAVEEQAS